MTSLRRWAMVCGPLLLLACDGKSTGRISLQLTDAAGALDQAVVTISRVELVGQSGAVVLLDEPVTMDLLTLANHTAELVTDAVVPSGTYSQLRFVVSGAYIAVPQEGGDPLVYASSPGYEGLPPGAVVAGELRMPSYSESGLKVNLPDGGVHVGTGSQVLLVDFDVAQSFGHDAGQSGAWVMHPVLAAIALQLSGTVNVTLALAPGVTLPGSATLAQFSAVLVNADGNPETLPLVPLGDGTFGASFRYLMPGSYTLGLTASGVGAFTTAPPVPAAITVQSGQPTQVTLVLTSAS